MTEIKITLRVRTDGATSFSINSHKEYPINKCYWCSRMYWKTKKDALNAIEVAIQGGEVNKTEGLINVTRKPLKSIRTGFIKRRIVR